MRQNNYTDTQIANHILKNHLKIDLNVEQIGNIVFNETRSLSGENIESARENVAHVVINGEETWGANRNKYANTASTVVTDAAKQADSQQYNDSQAAAINAVLNHITSGDPTNGAEHFNFRRNDSTGNFQGASIRTQIGPLNNSYPTTTLPATGIYANTYKRP